MCVCVLFWTSTCCNLQLFDVEYANQAPQTLNKPMWLNVSCIDPCVCLSVYDFGEGGLVEKNRWRWSLQS